MGILEEVIIPQSRNEFLEVIRGQDLPFVLLIPYSIIDPESRMHHMAY